MSDTPYGTDGVRRSLVHFAFGKAVAAALGVALLVIIVRLLPPRDYGVYTILLAALEITQLGSNFGLTAAALRYVPSLRTNSQGALLFKLVIYLCFGRLVTLILAVVFLWLSLQWITVFFGLQDYYYIFVLYLMVIVSEGFARYLDILFDSLLMQGAAQFSIVMRSGFRLIGVAGFVCFGDLSLQDWVYIELYASAAAATISIIQLLAHVNYVRRNLPGTNEGSRFLVCLRFSLSSYFAQVIGLLYGPETLKLIVARVIGTSEAGAFGFTASLASTLFRYMPGLLLLGMLRPIFVAAQQYPDHRTRLNRLVNILYKINMFVLIPISVFVTIYGDVISTVLSSGKFPLAGGYLMLFVVLLIFQVWHAILGLVALAMENGSSSLIATIVSSLGLAFGISLLPRYGVYGLCIGLFTSEILWCLVAHTILAYRGAILRLDWNSLFRIFWCAIISGAVVFFMRFDISNATSLSIIGWSTVMGALYLMLLFFWKPFRADERQLVNRMLPRPVFVW